MLKKAIIQQCLKICLVSLLFIGCDSDIKVYVGDSATQSLVRDQDPTDVIPASAVKFDDMFCVDSDDMATLIEKCEDAEFVRYD